MYDKCYKTQQTLEGGDLKMSNIKLLKHQEAVLAQTKNQNKVAYYLD